MNFLLDTNVCIALVNGDRDIAGASAIIRQRFIQSRRSGQSLFISSIMVHELWYGVSKSERVAINARRLSDFLAREFRVLDFSERDAQTAGEIRAILERKGQRIGEYDTLIAGQALARGLTLVTANTREFARVDGLKLADWTQ